MAKIERSSQAQRDLVDIWLYIANDSPAAADKFLDQIDTLCKLLSTSPLLGRSREELGRSLRSFPVGDYLIFYRPKRTGIVVVRVLSGYRDLDKLLL
ncbi:MAG: type II toxin-antitoxin system RelE/ParE family toxin [Terriglobia bacterium]